jgi:hypothetical protein
LIAFSFCKLISTASVDWKSSLNNISLGDAIMIEGDVMLQGQGTDKQTLTPIMAKLPDTTRLYGSNYSHVYAIFHRAVT